MVQQLESSIRMGQHQDGTTSGWDNIRMGQLSSLKRPPTALLSFLDIYTLFFKEKGMLHSGKYVAILLCGNVCVFVLMCKLCCWCYYSRFFGFHVSWSSIKVFFFFGHLLFRSFLQSTSWQNASCSSGDALKQSSSNPYTCPASCFKHQLGRQNLYLHANISHPLTGAVMKG